MSQQPTITPETLAGHYFPNLPQTPYQSAGEQRDQWLRFLDMLCAAMLLYKEAGGGEAAAFRSPLGQERELAQSLLPPPPPVFACRPSFSAVLEGLLHRGEQTAAAGLATPWNALLELIQPDLPGLLGLLCAFAADHSRKYERLFGALQEQSQPMGLPTAGLAEDLCLLLTPADLGPSSLLDPDSLTGALVWLPVAPPAGFSRLCRPLALHPRIYDFLSGNQPSPGPLEEYAQLFTPEEDPGPPEGKPDHRTAAALIPQLMEEGNALLHLQGPAGCGKTFFARCLAREMGTDLLALDVGLLRSLPPQQQRQTALDAARYCLLTGSLLLVRDADAQGEAADAYRNFLSLLCGPLPLVLVSSGEENPACFPAGARRHTIRLERPDKPAQLALWRHFSGALRPLLAPSVSVQELCVRYDLTPRQIRDVLSDAAAQCAARGENSVGLAPIIRAVHTSCRADLGTSATRLSAPFTWADLKLEPKAEQALRKACDRLRCRGIVNLDYGFNKKLPYGKGLSVLFYGPPGTGKTMAAQVMANDLGLDLYRIDLAQISSKYIGETQKNLSAVFDSARYSNAILFFDEADALFAKRTDVSTSNDRYANAETAFLLQKVEEYPGVTILATNHTQNFDPAFRRRITFQINLMQPDAALRLEIWRSVFPPEAPLEPGIDLERLAERAELTGSGIKAAAVAAAYAAAAGDGVITISMLRQAAAEELRKNGRMVEDYELI